MEKKQPMTVSASVRAKGGRRRVEGEQSVNDLGLRAASRSRLVWEG